MRSRFVRAFALLAAVALATSGCARASAPPASAEARLRALHEKVMRAHRESNVDLLLEDEAADYVVASRGEITHPTIEQRRERFGAYLGATTFSEYRDAVEPVVSVSADGTLGWVVVQVEAKGQQRTGPDALEPVEFVSAWIELYEKRDGKWQRTGNVSNFKP